MRACVSATTLTGREFRTRLNVLHGQAAGGFEVLPGHLRELSPEGAIGRSDRGAFDLGHDAQVCARAYAMARQLLRCDTAVSTHHDLEARIRAHRAHDHTVRR
jgi:hypothetical protein